MAVDIEETSFQNLWIHPCRFCLFFFFSRINLTSSLKKTKVKLVLLIDIDMLLMIEKRNKVATCHTIYRYVQTMMNTKNYHILAIRTSIIYMDEECLRGFLLMVLNWLKNHFNLMNISTKSYNDDSNEGHFLEVDVQYPNNLNKILNNLSILPERMKILKVENIGKSA